MLPLIENFISNNRDSDGTDNEKSHLFRVALAAFIIMIAGTLLYPDTFTSAGFRLGSFRISALALLFFIAAPPVLAYALSRRGALTPGIIDAALLLMVGFMTIRGFAAATNGNEMGLVAAFAVYTILLYYGASILGQHSSALRAISLSFAILAVIISFYAIIEFIIKENVLFAALVAEKAPVKSAEFYRSGSTLGQPLVLGAFLITVMPLQIYFYFREKFLFRHVFWSLSIILSAAALVISFSKGSWITGAMLLFAAVIIIIFNLKKFQGSLKPLVTLTAVVIALSIILIAFTYKEFKFNVFSSERKIESITMRWNMWEAAPGVIIDNYMIGVGMWRGGRAVRDVAFTETELEFMAADNDENVYPVDNLYLTTMVEEGLIGTSLLILTIFLIGRQAWSLVRQKGRHRSIVISLAAGMVAVLVNGITMDTLLIFPIMFIFWIYAGLIRAQAEAVRHIGDSS